MNQPNIRKTKIVATLGPATEELTQIKELIKAGANVFRLNFSHGSFDEHQKKLDNIKAACSELNAQVAILQDLGGPKIRITEVDPEKTLLTQNSLISLSRNSDGKISNNKNLYIKMLDPAKIAKVGDQVLLADGMIDLEVEQVLDTEIKCRIKREGNLRSRVGICFPDSDLALPATTEKDLNDLEWGIKNKVDYVAISFVQNQEDVLRVKRILDKNNSPIKLISKIEMKAALKNLETIIDVSDGIMVARGDLGVEIPVQRVPHVQNELINLSNIKGKPVIVATQMLHSMVKATRPTRAEVTDVTQAVLAGADAVMLSEETAIGDNPIEAVKFLNLIALEAENNFNYKEYKLKILRNELKTTISDSIAIAARYAASKLENSVIIACTETGNSARLVSKYRPKEIIFGTSSNIATIRRMQLYWGVTPIFFKEPKNHTEEIDSAIASVKSQSFIKEGTIAVITGGLYVKKPGTTSILEIKVF